jgi:hypothetical protein
VKLIALALALAVLWGSALCADPTEETPGGAAEGSDYALGRKALEAKDWAGAILNPRHRGAHEYIGEAYLMVHDLPKAEEHLAALQQICLVPCEEHADLAKAIAAYRQGAAK